MIQTIIKAPQQVLEDRYSNIVLRLLMMDKDEVSIVTSNKLTTITLLGGIKPEMISSDEFGLMLNDSDIQFEKLVLWIPCLASVLDLEVPESFPHSTIPEVKDEEDVISEARQLKVGEYFEHSTDGEIAVVRSKFKRAGASNYLASDYPNKDLFGLFYLTLFQSWMGELLASGKVDKVEALSDEGKDSFIEKYYVVTE